MRKSAPKNGNIKIKIYIGRRVGAEGANATAFFGVFGKTAEGLVARSGLYAYRWNGISLLST